MLNTPNTLQPNPISSHQFSSEESALINNDADTIENETTSKSTSESASGSASVSLSVEDDSDNSDDSMTSMGATKRRLGCPPLAPKAHSNPPPFPLPPALSFVAGRRRRLFAYLAAFAVMLALSSMLDLRRAAVSAKKNDKITLSLPSATTVNDASTSITQNPADGAAIADAVVTNTKSKHTHSSTLQAHNVPLTPAGSADTHAHTQNTASEEKSTIPGSKLSDQELKDDVDQLISHVEQEASANTTATNTAGNSTPTSTSNSRISTSDVHAKHSATPMKQADTTKVGATQPGVEVLHDGSVTNTGASITSTSGVNSESGKNETSASEEGATIEEQFIAAQTEMERLSSNNTLKPILETRSEELRTLKALALQAARGDCEKAAEPAAGSLFKTDAEASGADIEKTDPLWGAWCVNSGRYRSEAMRDYLARTRAFRVSLEAELEKRASGTNTQSDESARFDDIAAATLDDVLTPDAQALLRAKAGRILPHLSDTDARLLAALSLQATFGDCAPYALKRLEFNRLRTSTAKTQAEEMKLAKQPPRELIEPIFGRKAIPGEGALWGAWCVFTNRKRATVASKLTERVDGFWKQLNDAAANTNYT